MSEVKLRFKQYPLFIGGEEIEGGRVAILPDVPYDVNDRFLKHYFVRSVKPTTLKNMYSRWLLAASSYLNIGHKKKLEGDLDVLVVTANKEGGLYSAYGYTAIINALSDSIIDSPEQIKGLHFRAVKIPDEGPQQPSVMITLTKAGEGIFDNPISTYQEYQQALVELFTNNQ